MPLLTELHVRTHGLFSAQSFPALGLAQRIWLVKGANFGHIETKKKRSRVFETELFMSTVKYQLRVKGLTTPDGTIPVRALLELLQGLVDTAERGLRLAIQGESVKRGRVPAWLEKAVNLNRTGLRIGSTILDTQAAISG